MERHRELLPRRRERRREQRRRVVLPRAQRGREEHHWPHRVLERRERRALRGRRSPEGSGLAESRRSRSARASPPTNRGKPFTVSLRNLLSPSCRAARLRLGPRRSRTEGNLPRFPSVTSLPPITELAAG